VVKENTIYSKFDTKMLDIIYEIACLQDVPFESDYLFVMVENFKKLIENSDKHLKVVTRPEKMMEENEENNIYVEVSCKAFCVLAGYYATQINDASSIPSQNFFNETLF